MTEREFAEIIAETKAVVLSAIGKTLPSRFYHAVDDVAQETYIRAYRGLAGNTFRGEAALSSWLYKIARNESLRMAKKLLREEEKSRRAADDVNREKGALAWQADGGHDDEKIAAMTRAIAGLPAKYRDVFDLLIRGHPEKEIARRLSIRPGTVKSRISRGKELIARLIEGGEK